jgi:hypothetical protein
MPALTSTAPGGERAAQPTYTHDQCSALLHTPQGCCPGGWPASLEGSRWTS